MDARRATRDTGMSPTHGLVLARPRPRALTQVSIWTVMLGVAVIAFNVRLVLAMLTFGTSDIMAWELLGQTFLAGENFYATQLHNWPPLWIYFTAAAWLAHQATGLPFAALVKLPPLKAIVIVSATL